MLRRDSMGKVYTSPDLALQFNLMLAWNRRLRRSFGMKENFEFKMLRRGRQNKWERRQRTVGRGGRGVYSCQSGDPRPEGGQRFYSTIISGTRGVKNGVKGCLKQHLLHRVHHVTVSHFSWLVQSNATNSYPPPLTTFTGLLRIHASVGSGWRTYRFKLWEEATLTISTALAHFSPR